MKNNQYDDESMHYDDKNVESDSSIYETDTHNVIIETGENGITKKVKIDLEVDATAKNYGPNPYVRWIHLARAIDAWRPFPRLFIILYMYMVYRVIEWYLTLPDPSMEQSGLISVVVGAGAAWFGLYVGSGGKTPKE